MKQQYLAYCLSIPPPKPRTIINFIDSESPKGFDRIYSILSFANPRGKVRRQIVVQIYYHQFKIDSSPLLLFAKTNFIKSKQVTSNSSLRKSTS